MQKWHFFDGTQYSGDFWFTDYESGGRRGSDID